MAFNQTATTIWPNLQGSVSHLCKRWLSLKDGPVGAKLRKKAKILARDAGLSTHFIGFINVIIVLLLLFLLTQELELIKFPIVKVEFQTATNQRNIIIIITY